MGSDGGGGTWWSWLVVVEDRQEWLVVGLLGAGVDPMGGGRDGGDGRSNEGGTRSDEGDDRSGIEKGLWRQKVKAKKARALRKS